MPSSTTVIIALRYSEGVVFASDSQTSDPVHNVRWPTTKARQVGEHPLVMGFSGNTGVSGRARESVEALSFRATTFQRRERVRAMVEGALTKHYDWIAGQMRPDSAFAQVVGAPQMIALAACFADGQPHIIEFEANGDSDFHESFHAVGSGASTAYAVWRTLGSRRLRELGEGRAIHVALRIMRTAVAVDMMGVSEPYTVFVVDGDGARQLPSADVDSEMQAVQEWEEEQIQQLLG